MFEGCETSGTGSHAVATREPLSASMIQSWMDALVGVDRDTTDAERIDLIRGLERLKAGAAAAQAVLTADFDASQRRAQADAGVPARRQGEGIAAQVALARRESPVRGARDVKLANALVHDLTGLLAGMKSGRISEWRATLVDRETSHLTRADRVTVDATLTADLDALEGMGDRALAAEARRLAYLLDPEGILRRQRKAESERRVTIRPAPDTMTYVTALLPVAQGVAVYAALTRDADNARAFGDDRTRGQVMADSLVQRVTGQRLASDVPVHVNLVMTDRSLLAGDDEPAHLDGYGPVPAAWSRALVAHAAEGVGAWLRRLYTAPATGALVAMDSRQRQAPQGLATFIRARDVRCRTPWCDAPIRHVDHTVPIAAGGETSEPNLGGRCEACNYAKEAVGWRARPRAGPRHTIEVRTPTGHTYRSTAPPPPGSIQPPSRMELYAADILLAA